MTVDGSDDRGQGDVVETSVLIVGGGLTGLAIATALQEERRPFVLVDGRDRWGGRIHRARVDGSDFDLGPAWFWPGQPRMRALAEQFGLTVFSQHSEGVDLFEDAAGHLHRNAGYASMAGSLRIDGGFMALVDAMVAALPPERLHLLHAVKTLAHTDSGVRARVLAPEGPLSIDAERVIVAAPPRLVAHSIALDGVSTPEQRETMAAIPTWMAGHAKIVAVYDHAPWRAAGFSGDVLSQRGPLVEIHDASPRNMQSFALFGFVGVPAGQRGTPAALLDSARAQLERTFGRAAGQPKAMRLQDWAAEPFTATPRDAVMLRHHPAYGLPAALRELGRGRVSLVCTETAPAHGGFLEGALEAAADVIRT